MSLSLKSMGFVCATALVIGGCGKKPADESTVADAIEPTTTSESPAPDASSGTETAAAADSSKQLIAVARLKPTKGNKVQATVTFTQTGPTVKVGVDAEGLSAGEHGFHIHDKGDCSAPDASSAGDHFNPKQMPHGAPDAEQRHSGDFGNLRADASGVAHAEFDDAHISLEGATSVIGRAAIIHGKADDLTSQPSGNAGPRVACGVIEAGGGTMQ